MKLVQYPNPILLAKCDLITKEDDVESLVADMTKIMIENRGVGIAANQLGISKQLFLVTLEKGQIFPFINPSILYSHGSVLDKEGCLSLKGIFLDVIRPDQITVEYDDANFERKQAVLYGKEARIFQHEYEHITQKFFLDNVSRQVRRQILRELKK